MLPHNRMKQCTVLHSPCADIQTQYTSKMQGIANILWKKSKIDMYCIKK